MTALFAVLLIAAVVGIFKPYINGLTRVHFAVAAVVSFFLIGVTAPEPAREGAGSTPSGEREATAGKSGGPAPDGGVAPQAAATKWEYSEELDQMRGTRTRYARLESENEVDLDFPYGRQRGILWVRHRPEDGLQIMLAVESGQILCHRFRRSTIAFKFDDKPLQTYGCDGSSDGSNETAFVESPARVLRELRGARRTMVEAEFFRRGRQQFVFDTAALRWDQ